jgi:hypothetical protein
MEGTGLMPAAHIQVTRSELRHTVPGPLFPQRDQPEVDHPPIDPRLDLFQIRSEYLDQIVCRLRPVHRLVWSLRIENMETDVSFDHLGHQSIHGAAASCVSHKTLSRGLDKHTPAGISCSRVALRFPIILEERRPIHV